MIKHLMEQYSEAWFQVRLGRVTGTGFSKLMSNTDTMTGYKGLILDISGEILTEEKEDVEDFSNANMEKGTEREPLARELYEEINKIKVEQVGFITPDEDNEFADWIGISPDGLVGNEGGLEIKCPLRKTHLNYIEENKLPSVYLNQVQAALFITRRKWWDFMSYHPNMKPFIIRVFPDIELHKKFEIKLRQAILEIKQKINNYNNYKSKI